MKHNKGIKYNLWDWISLIWHRLIWNRIRDLYYICKYGFQRMFRGYDDTQVFNLDLGLIKYLYNVLKDFRAHCQGYPNNYTSEEWLAMLDEMVWCFKEANPETCSQQNEIEYDMDFEFTPSTKEGFVELSIVYPTKEDEEKSKLSSIRNKEIEDYQQENLQKGLKMLSEHFYSLWY